MSYKREGGTKQSEGISPEQIQVWCENEPVGTLLAYEKRTISGARFYKVGPLTVRRNYGNVQWHLEYGEGTADYVSWSPTQEDATRRFDTMSFVRGGTEDTIVGVGLTLKLHGVENTVQIISNNSVIQMKYQSSGGEHV